MWVAVRENGDFFALAVRITGKLLKTWVHAARRFVSIEFFSVHTTLSVIAPGASSGETKMW